MVRKILGSMLAALITVGLFLLMHYLIIPADKVPTEMVSQPSIKITRAERDESSERSERNKPIRPVQEKTPPPQFIKTSMPIVNQGPVISYKKPTTGIGGRLEKVKAPSNRRATPLVRIPPQYPSRPLRNNIEGWVLVEFTITKTGTVEDVVVVDGEPNGVFDRSTIRAIQRWKYQPKVVDGKPIPQYNMQELVTYKIED